MIHRKERIIQKDGTNGGKEEARWSERRGSNRIATEALNKMERKERTDGCRASNGIEHSENSE
jgi:hypothetical protein